MGEFYLKDNFINSWKTRMLSDFWDYYAFKWYEALEKLKILYKIPDKKNQISKFKFQKSKDQISKKKQILAKNLNFDKSPNFGKKKLSFKKNKNFGKKLKFRKKTASI